MLQPSNPPPKYTRATKEGRNACKDDQCTVATSISKASAPTPRKALNERLTQGSRRNIPNTATGGQTSENHTRIGVIPPLLDVPHNAWPSACEASGKKPVDEGEDVQGRQADGKTPYNEDADGGSDGGYQDAVCDMPFVDDGTHQDTSEDRSNVEENDGQSTKSAGCSKGSCKGWKVYGWKKKAERFDDVACLQNGERRGQDEGKIPGVRRVGRRVRDPGLNEVEEWTGKDEQGDGPCSQRGAEAIGAE